MQIRIPPRRKRGAQSAQAKVEHEKALDDFCEDMMELRRIVGFAVSARGLCYQSEPYGITKADFDYVEKLINDCRKDGRLPVDFTSADDARTVHDLEITPDQVGPREYAKWLMIDNYNYPNYYPFARWDDERYYVEMLVEKKDLVPLFRPITQDYGVPIGNAKGQADINSRAARMQRFQAHEEAGRIPVLLYCGDFDPGGLCIADGLRRNMEALAPAVGWWPDNVIIHHFGVTYEFIEEHGLIWIDNLISGHKDGKCMSKPSSWPNRQIPGYVQDYIDKYGVRKVEANALLARPEAALELCNSAIAKFLDIEDAESHRDAIQRANDEVRAVWAEVSAEIAAERD